MIKRSSLHKYSGEDAVIIRKSDDAAQSDFSLIGLFVLFIFSLCFVSASLFFFRLFHNMLLAIPIGVMCGLMFTNTYLLLLYTITPSLVKYSKDEAAKKQLNKEYKSKTARSALILRVGFVVFIAILISQPIKVLMMTITNESEITGYINEHKNEIRREAGKSISVLKNQSANQLESLIQHSDFYVYTIRIVNSKFPVSQLITLSFIGIFILPIYWKFQLRKNSNFYNNKEQIEQQIVRDEYANFKMQYKKIFQSKYALNLDFYEPYSDPPFNAVKKSNIQDAGKQDELLKEVYGC